MPQRQIRFEGTPVSSDLSGNQFNNVHIYYTYYVRVCAFTYVCVQEYDKVIKESAEKVKLATQIHDLVCWLKMLIFCFSTCINVFTHKIAA